MDDRLLAVIVPLGVVALAMAPTLTPPDRVALHEAVDRTGPVRLEGVVATLHEADTGTELLVENGTAVWIVVEGRPDVAPGDRVRVTARLDDGTVVADADDVQVVAADGTDLLRDIARDPAGREGNLVVEATLARVYETVAYLKDAGHRLRVEPGRGSWPPTLERGARVEVAGRLVYDSSEMRYVLMLDGIEHA